ncbi:MAG: hypothetical protein P8Z71_08850 [Candidatus Sulfobium sp.]
MPRRARLDFPGTLHHVIVRGIEKKSIVQDDEDAYLLELVRYIHLNPVRAGLIKGMDDLDRYRYSGHSVIMGRVKNDWQDRDYILRQFGNKEREAKREYRKFVVEGIADGKRSDLVGGGLVRSHGGWSQLVTMRGKGMVEAADDRILGSGQFVEQILEEAEERIRQQFPLLERRKKIEQVLRTVCREEQITPQELQSGSRRGRIPAIRRKIAEQLVKHSGIPMAEAARLLGVSVSAISKALRE